MDCVFAEHNTTLFSDDNKWESVGYDLSDANVDRSNIPSVTLHVKPNNLIYIPSNWAHEVTTTSLSISINCFI